MSFKKYINEKLWKLALKIRLDYLRKCHQSLVLLALNNGEAQPHINNAKYEIISAILEMERMINKTSHCKK